MKTVKLISLALVIGTFFLPVSAEAAGSAVSHRVEGHLVVNLMDDQVVSDEDFGGALTGAGAGASAGGGALIIRTDSDVDTIAAASPTSQTGVAMKSVKAESKSPASKVVGLRATALRLN